MKSFRLRLALLSAMISAAIIAGMATAGLFLFKRVLLESVDLELAVPVDRIARELHPYTDYRRVFRNADIAYGSDIEDGKTLLMMRHDVTGDIIYQKPDNWITAVDPAIWEIEVPPRRPLRESEEGALPPHLFEHPGFEKGKGKGKAKGPPDFQSESPIEYHDIETDGKHWRVGLQRNHGHTVMMGRSLAEYQSEMSKLMKMLFIAAPFCLFFIGLGGWFIGHRAMKPLAVITDTASSITTRDLHERIPVKRGEYHEFANLISVLNLMMDRLERGFTHAMRFSADVSHELKTPITIMQAELNSALKECEPGSREEKALQTISQESHRLKAITGSLMLLSQAESGRLVAKKDRISLSNEISDIAEDTEILCEKSGLSLSTDIEEGITLTTDKTLLHQAILNLVSNAVKYNQPKGWIKISLQKHSLSSEAIFRISNSGSGIPTDEQDKIFERFYRIDKARDRSIDGFGLGLNLSFEIITVLGGELDLLKADSDETTFQVRLPVDN